MMKNHLMRDIFIRITEQQKPTSINHIVQNVAQYIFQLHQEDILYLPDSLGQVSL